MPLRMLTRLFSFSRTTSTPKPDRLAPFTSSPNPIRLCSMAPMEGDTAPLFRLPEELLEIVVEQALAEAVPASVLLLTCARLGRITRKLHYARIEYGGEAERFAKLVELMKARRDLRILVKEVTIRPVFDRDDSDGDSYAYPGTTHIFVRFPSLKTLRIIGAPLSLVTKTLASAPDSLLPPLQHVAIELSGAEWSRFSELSWWESLARFPDLGELTLSGRFNLGRSGNDRADPEERPQVPAMLKSLHTLTIGYLPAPTDGAAAFTDELPALTNLAVDGEEAMTSRWLSIAPPSLTHITLGAADDYKLDELPRQLGRFPDLQHLRLIGNGGLKNFVPFLRTNKLRHLELHYDTTCELFHDVGPLLDLICGPDRMSTSGRYTSGQTPTIAKRATSICETVSAPRSRARPTNTL